MSAIQSVSAKTACAFLLAAALGAPAFAASNDTGSSQSNANSGASSTTAGQQGMNQNQQGASGQNTPAGRQIVQKVRDDLTKAGYSDIQVMPSSFLVRAKDSSGNPVIMLINPDSVTAITEEQGGAQGGTNAQSGSNAAQTGRSTGGSQPVTPGAPTPPTKTTP
jgi:hypothetical protein